MEKEGTEILDNFESKPMAKRLWTIYLLILGGGISAVTFLVATFWDTLGLGYAATIWIGLSLVVSFGLNLAGFIVGLIERLKNPKRALVGIIGNLVFVLFFVTILAFSFIS